MTLSKLTEQFVRGDFDPEEIARKLEEEHQLAELEQNKSRLEREERRAARKQIEADNRKASWDRHLKILHAQIKGEAPPTGVGYWLLLDTWTPDQAFCLFSGYSPENIKFDGDGKRIVSPRGQFDGLMTVSGLNVDGFYVKKFFGEGFQNVYLDRFTRCYATYRGIWVTGHKMDELHPPEYFIKWAIQKRSPPLWLDWAVANKFLDVSEKDMEKSPTIEIDDKQNKQLDSRTESAYLNIIGALCTVYWEATHPERPKIVQQEIIDSLANFNGIYGMSERNLREKISLAIKSIQSSK